MSAPARFEAWALPSGVAVPHEVSVEYEGGVAVVRLDATPGWMGEVCRALEASRAALMDVPALEIADALGAVGARFLHPTDPVRRHALDALPATSGLSPEMSETVLDGMARDWTADRLRALLGLELEDPAALDGFVDGGPRGRVRAVGPALCTQVVSGSVPGVSATALIRSLLVKGPTLLKPGLGDVVLPVLFARALAETDARLADALAVVYWPGGSTALEDVALRAADVVVAYGGDDTVRALRDRTPVATRFVPYPHRVSVGAVGRESLGPGIAERTALEVAGAVSMFDQRGCVSPHVVWVEEGGGVAPRGFAEMVAGALAELEARWPSGRLDAEEASAAQQARGGAELLAAAGGDVRVWRGDRAAWTVVWEGDPAPAADDVAAMCVGRVVRVRPIAALEELPARVAPWARQVQTVALAARVTGVAESLAKVGVTRIAPFWDVPFPPAWWRQDGRGVLAELVRWVEVEG
ncbi:MAG TPA: acyl-CoA reductase [Longimicrobiales bacterium]|nr:acyl-CoA reductase [Longimicrobiales bacterium]